MLTTRQKIKTIRELESLVATEKSAGRRVVYWHGAFELLDLDHIRQLDAARSLGDVLVLSVIPDRYIHAHDGRLHSTDQLRAEAVAALQSVDYVAISEAQSAAAAIRALKPDVYVHASDGDLAGELDALQAVGGVPRRADDLGAATMRVLTSRLWSPIADEVGVWLDEFRKRHSAEEILGALETLRPLRVAIVGEVVLDEYVYCEAMGKSAKEPILALRYLERDVHAGGSIAIANHLADFCSHVDLVAYLGSHSSHEEFVLSSLKSNVQPSFLRKADSPTIVKRRFVEKYMVTKLLEIYEINDEPLSATEEQELDDRLEKLLPQCDVVIVADFGHGLIPPRTADLLCEKSPFLAVNTQINAANVGFHTISKYKRADYVCIHEGEVRLDARTRRAELQGLVAQLAERLQCETVMVTRGSTGTLLYRPDGGFVACPALAVKVVDRLGAGDAVLAITALCAAKGFPPDVIGFIGNLVGAQAVRIVGNSRSIDRAELLRNVETLLR